MDGNSAGIPRVTFVRSAPSAYFHASAGLIR